MEVMDEADEVDDIGFLHHEGLEGLSVHDGHRASRGNVAPPIDAELEHSEIGH